MEYIVVWYFDAGFRSGTETKECETLEKAVEYIEANKINMISPRVYKKVNLQEV
ncbi:hypothetical protein [Cohnella sp. GCM10027633]|uniref:hypothetical protein n=1 Tax=unclassified Cohnella TaxID=2636738 RepID=UPI0036426840